MTEARSDTGSGAKPEAVADEEQARDVSSDTERPEEPSPAVLSAEFRSDAELAEEERAYADAFPPDPEQETHTGPGLHQPRRALIAAGEVIAVVALALVAVWAWNHGIVKLAYPLEGRDPLISTRYHGNWLGTAVACVTVAAVLLLDAVRQVVLAARTRPGKAADADV